MSRNLRIFIAIGGTGGHVFPGCNLATHLKKKNYDIKLITDNRGKKYLKEFKYFKISTLPSSPLIKKNIFTFFSSFIFILYSILISLIFLILNRPKIIFGMGGYASFPICAAATILKIKFIIYENNLIVGKTNKYLLPFADKMLIANEELEGVPSKFDKKIFKVGNIIKKEIINFSEKNKRIKKNKKINILVLGGSQAAKIFAEQLPIIFRQCLADGIPIKVFQHCLPYQNDRLSLFYNNSNIDFEIFNFSNNLENYFSKVNLAITRAGSSMLAELTNANIPFISIPLPTSADEHQLKNARFYKRKNFSFLIEEKELDSKLFLLLKDIDKNYSILSKIASNQRQYSDKNVYNNIDQALKKIIHEKY